MKPSKKPMSMASRMASVSLTRRCLDRRRAKTVLWRRTVPKLKGTVCKTVMFISGSTPSGASNTYLLERKRSPRHGQMGLR